MPVVVEVCSMVLPETGLMDIVEDALSNAENVEEALAVIPPVIVSSEPSKVRLASSTIALVLFPVRIRLLTKEVAPVPPFDTVTGVISDRVVPV